MAKWTVLYSNKDGDAKHVIVDDTTNCSLPIGVDDVLREHDGKFNSDASVFVIFNEDDLDVMGSDGEEIGRAFLIL